MRNKLGFFHPAIIIAILLVATVGLAAFWASNNPRTPLVSESTPSPEAMMVDEMSDWESYVNSEFGISFKYPPDWELYEYDTENNSISICKLGPDSNQFKFVDGACLSFSISDSMEVDLEDSQYEVSEFGFDGWTGIRDTYYHDFPENTPEKFNDVIIAKKTFTNSVIWEVLWIQMDSRISLTAEEYLIPILSTFESTN